MLTDFFDSIRARLFEALRREKGNCPDSEVLVAYHQGDISGGEKRLLEEHLSLCSICGELLDRLQQAEIPVDNRETPWVFSERPVDDQIWYRAERRLDRKPAPWRTELKAETTGRSRERRYWLAAAAVVLALGGVVVWNSRDSSLTPSGPVSLTRGEVIYLHDPAGAVGALRVFTWSALPVAGRFRLQVRRQERIVWEATVEEPRYRPSPELLQLLMPQERFEWRIQGLDTDGNVVAESSWMAFERSP